MKGLTKLTITEDTKVSVGNQLYLLEKGDNIFMDGNGRYLVKMKVDKDATIFLNGQKYMLESGDEILLEAIPLLGALAGGAARAVGAAAKAGGALAGKAAQAIAAGGKALGKAAVAGGKALGKAAMAGGKALGKAAVAGGKAAGKAALAGGKALGKAAIQAFKGMGKQAMEALININDTSRLMKIAETISKQTGTEMNFDPNDINSMKYWIARTYEDIPQLATSPISRMFGMQRVSPVVAQRMVVDAIKADPSLAIRILEALPALQ